MGEAGGATAPPKKPKKTALCFPMEIPGWKDIPGAWKDIPGAWNVKGRSTKLGYHQECSIKLG